MVYIFNLMWCFWNCFLKKGSNTAGNRSDIDSIQRTTQNLYTYTITCTEYALQNGRVTTKSLFMINPYITQSLWLRGGQHSIKQKLSHRTSQQISAVRRIVRSQLCLKFHKYIWRSAPLYLLRAISSAKINYSSQKNPLFKLCNLRRSAAFNNYKKKNPKNPKKQKKEKKKQTKNKNKHHKSLSNNVKCN